MRNLIDDLVEQKKVSPDHLMGYMLIDFTRHPTGEPYDRSKTANNIAPPSTRSYLPAPCFGRQTGWRRAIYGIHAR